MRDEYKCEKYVLYTDILSKKNYSLDIYLIGNSYFDGLMSANMCNGQDKTG